MTGVANRPAPPPRAGSPEPSAAAPRLRAVEALERELQARRVGRLYRGLAALLLIAAAFGGYRLLGGGETGEEKERYVTEPVEVRDVVETVESSGKLRPLTEVQVGAQVSGRVVAVHVDFNSRVKKGQLLAEIDPSLFGAQVSEVTGQLTAAKAQLERAQATRVAADRVLRRTEQLEQEAIATQAELDQARTAFELAEADVVSARAQIQRLTAQLGSANTTLAYTKIYSPIDGVVINRAVDPGQTVAASFSAPVMFVIAQDLTQMQVLADIDEADVGKVREGMTARVSVDAFPGEVFEGRLTQLRFSPTEVQGVVTYAAVLEVPNPDLQLRPGMTATVSITAREAKQVPAVRNAALRFKPSAGAASEVPPRELAFNQRRVHLLAQRSAQPAEKPESGGSEKRAAAASLEARIVTVGVTDGAWTQLVQGAPEPGTQVVIRENVPEEKRRRKFLGIF